MLDPYHRNQSIMYNLSIHNIKAYKKMKLERNIIFIFPVVICIAFFFIICWRWYNRYDMMVKFDQP